MVVIEHVEMKQLEGQWRDCGRVDLPHAGTIPQPRPQWSIRAGSKGYDSELPTSYHQGKAMIDRVGREAAEGLWRECGWINTSGHWYSFYLIDSDILSQCCMGQWCPSVPWHMHGPCSICSEAIRTLARVQTTMSQQQHNQQWNKASLGKHCTRHMAPILRMHTIHMSLT